jgi:hypothetical protein
MRRPLPGVVAAFAVAFAFATTPARADPPGAPCPASPVVVVGADDEDVRTICDGARDALGFLIGLGLLAPGRIEVSVAARMPERYHPDAAGVYDPFTATVHLRDYAAFARFGAWLGQPIDRSMYRSIATHEVAHAIASVNFAMPRPPVLAREYVAYVTQFATMAPAFRDRALALHPQPACTPPDESTDLAYEMDPMRFGVCAWRHWTGLADAPAFLWTVLRGEALRGP